MEKAVPDTQQNRFPGILSQEQKLNLPKSLHASPEYKSLLFYICILRRNEQISAQYRAARSVVSRFSACFTSDHPVLLGATNVDKHEVVCVGDVWTRFTPSTPPTPPQL